MVISKRSNSWKYWECRALAAAVAAFPAAAAKAEDATGVASSRMSYSRFLEYLEMGRVKKVR
jgi:cell division protease FtsH